MKIAFLSFYSGKVNRGVETFVKELSSRLEKNNEVLVFEGKASGSVLGFTLKVLLDIKNNFDVIVPTNGRSQVIICRLWSWLLGKKMLVSGHSGIGFDDYLNLWSRPNVFVVQTEFQKSWAKKFSFGVRIEKIPNGVDLKKFKPEGEKFSHGLPSKIVLSVSALTAPKRLDLIIRAVAKTKYSLLMVGDGPLRRELETLGNSLLPGRFKIVSVSYGQLPETYRSANIFTFVAYKRESFGIVLLEAMASGLPIVACDDPIRKEIVGDAGLFVNPKNSEEYTMALEKALKIDWGDKQRKQAEKYSWDKIAKQYDQLFRNLTGI